MSKAVLKFCHFVLYLVNNPSTFDGNRMRLFVPQYVPLFSAVINSFLLKIIFFLNKCQIYTCFAPVCIASHNTTNFIVSIFSRKLHKRKITDRNETKEFSVPLRGKTNGMW